jgi:hypothetical protein
MTEEEWPTCNEPSALVEYLAQPAEDNRNSLTARKSRFFAVSCCRLGGDRLKVGGMDALDIADRCADGADGDEELRVLRARLEQLIRPYWASMLPVILVAIDPSLAPSALALTCIRRVNGSTAIFSPALASLVRDIFGNPFRPVVIDPAWLTSTVLAIGRGIYDERAFDRLPILADALQDAGCENADLLTHLRSDGPHVRGCWALDLVLGKE